MGNNNSNDNNRKPSNSTNLAVQKYKQQNNDKDQKIQKIMSRHPNFSKQEATDILESFNGDIEEALGFCAWYEQDKEEKERKKQEEERARLQQQRAQQQRELQVARRQPEENEEDDNKEEQLENFINLLASVVLIERAGFQLVSKQNENVIAALKKIPCEGRTLLRDGICIGISHLLKLKAVLLRLKTFAQYKFVHIVLTDGEDTGSNTTVPELKQLFTILNKEIGDACKTFFIGVKLDPQGTKQLKEIVSLAGDAAEFHHCNDVGIGDIFSRIQLQLVRRQEIAVIGNEQMAIIAARQNYGLEVAINHYLVLFTLDTSGSMAGSRWKQVVESVSNFLESMPQHDIFGILLFNDKIKIITGSDE